MRRARLPLALALATAAGLALGLAVLPPASPERARENCVAISGGAPARLAECRR